MMPIKKIKIEYSNVLISYFFQSFIKKKMSSAEARVRCLRLLANCLHVRNQSYEYCGGR